MTTPSPDVRLQRVITARCTGKITRAECVEELRFWRSLLPKAQHKRHEGSGASWPQARAFTRLAGSLTPTSKVEQPERTV